MHVGDLRFAHGKSKETGLESEQAVQTCHLKKGKLFL